MDLRLLAKLVSTRDLRNIAVGMVVVLGGLALAGLTLFAHDRGDARLAGIAAGLSLIFVLLILIFVVPPLARNASREASQMNLPFEFTTGGAVMIVLLLVVGFSAWNTGNNLLFIVLSFMLSAMIVGFLAGRMTLQKLDVKLRFPETIFAGEKVPVTVALTNRKRLFPAFSVIVEVRGREREEVADADIIRAALPEFIARRLTRASLTSRTLEHVVYVPRRGNSESTVDHVFAKRGRFTIRDFELSTGFPFGFFRHRRRLAAHEAQLVIFPPAEGFDAYVELLPMTGTKTSSAKRGVGSDLLSMREYVQGDDLRRVDWKATARAQHLTVREFAADSDLRVAVIFDPVFVRDLADKENERFEAGVRIAASALTYLEENQAEFRLIADRTETDFSSGAGHLHDCLAILASVEPQENSELKPASERISDLDKAHSVLLVTADGGKSSLSDLHQKLKIIRF